jgi:Domain of unknown function (DUF4430)
MKTRHISLLVGAILCSLALVPAGAWGKTVSVRVEGANHTLVKRTLVTLGTGSFDKDGNPEHQCTATSAAAALEEATNGSWSGGWTDGLGYFVSKIRGETHSGSPDFWSFWRNDKSSSTGICGTKLRSGDELLFFVDQCVFDAASGACSNPVLPLELRLAKHQSKDGSTLVTVVAYTATGKSKRVAKASVLRDGVWLGKTDAKGRFRLKLKRKTVSLTAIKRGYARSDAVRAKLGS